MTKEALKLALEALEVPWNAPYVDGCDLALGKKVKVITAIKEALAQPEQEPVAVVVAAEFEDGSHAGHRLEWRGRNEANDFPEGTAFYTTPPQRKPLTDQQIVDLCDGTLTTWEQVRIARAIEAAHGITGEQK